ncbi:MAG TPA: Hsp20/alpha crystallin family protein [Ideonella sp.]|uniref:Hsp20/alpha crystallin family protein n=1 Tax=Ideonella sp. TaxID=1929293 RepID=UPI002E37BA2E|nr:Hsp20/alpha crystallin family protein [Ideonella sp.]HEX5685289.1 Hsp20/alpha crystallin family protein [Ideonella sp.]
MSTLTRIEPIDQMLPELFRRFVRPATFEKDTPADIRIDVTESDKAYQVRAEIPGAKREDIRVVVDGNYVSITAQVHKEKEESTDSRLLLKETYVGNLSRGFSLASDIDEKRVVARLEDGILKLTLPKREGGGSRRIEVQ